jgi:UDP-N-acetylmuramoyl-L-alanyl-D-glutamate--2,6-diaminopimelate ligase
MTTPDAVQLADLLAGMVASGCSHAVMEVSSHALDQRRADGIDFAAAAFTNLTPEHMDYHKTMPAYFAAKARLFAGLAGSAVAAINLDDEHGLPMRSCCAAGRTLTYGFKAGSDVRATILAQDASGTRFALVTPVGATEVRTVLIGRHNVSNCLAAAAVCCGLGVPLDRIAAGIAAQQVVPGRLQPVDVGGRFTVLVDYAHTDDAMENVLNAVRPLNPGAGILLVFGCGGDRDREKRPRMATVAERLADRIFVTNDNPRTEPPERILEDIRGGFSAKGLAKVTFQPDREQAICTALAAATEGDLVLIAGKGHEDYQILGRTKTHFDDREVVARWAADRQAAVG